MKKILLGLIGLLFTIPSWATDLPAGYTELEYIESTGTQYIVTDFFFNDIATDTLTCDFMRTGTGSGSLLYGFRDDYKVNGYGFQFNDVGRTYRQYGNSDSGLPSASAKQLNTRYTVQQTGYSYTIDGSSYDIAATDPVQNYPLVVFAIRNADAPPITFTPMRLYNLNVVTAGGNMILNLIPAKRNSDNEIGMYDTVSGTFFTNAGAGEFIAGPEVQIKIATTAYNSARFSPVVTELNNTIATIRDVVTNTINQTKAIADLQATKQTRPNETCPAGKKCLLVEDNDGQPHWYEIIENAD